MREWLIYNHPVSLTIFSPLQLNINGEKSVGLTISSQWHPWIVDDLACCLVTTCVHPRGSHHTAESTFPGQSCFSLLTLPVTVQRAGKPLPFQWWRCGQVLPWTRPRTRGRLLLPQHVTLLAECSHDERQETSLPQDQKQVYAFCFNFAANFNCGLTHQRSRIW